jgi:15-cis-phytoene synthase
MLDDTDIRSYETYTQLQHYMHGSACVVGEMMCYVVGLRSEHEIAATRPAAYALGEAMQLTNFLRDVREDYIDLGRIYMPDDEMQRYGLGNKQIKEFCHDRHANTNREAFCAYQITRCDLLYQHAYEGIPLLPRVARIPVRLAAKLYQRILRHIEHHHYNVFDKSMRTSKRKKLWTVAHTLCTR